MSTSALASSAFLDLELKQSARILATVSLGGVTKATYELQSGTTIGSPAAAGPRRRSRATTRRTPVRTPG